MENQHRKISGYRELSQAEIDLMNKIKAHAENVRLLAKEVRIHINGQHDATVAAGMDDDKELDRLTDADPYGWINAATHDLQTGFMKLTRAVAQPTTF